MFRLFIRFYWWIKWLVPIHAYHQFGLEIVIYGYYVFRIQIGTFSKNFLCVPTIDVKIAHILCLCYKFLNISRKLIYSVLQFIIYVIYLIRKSQLLYVERLNVLLDKAIKLLCYVPILMIEL